jgi:hypothetical protein
VILLTNNKPPCIPTPLVIILNEYASLIIQYNNINIAILLYKIDTSRRLFTALDNKVQIIESTNIV